MNLTWHIVKKDLRALKWAIALWTLLIIAKLLAGAVVLTADGTEEVNWFMHMQMLIYVFAGLECVSFVLAGALIQEDLLVGTTAFWATRPISGARLLRAKLLALLLVFGLLPLLVTLPWWLWNGYGPRELFWAMLQTAMIHAACVLAGLLWSVVTDGLARFLLWTLVMLVAIPIVAASVSLYVVKEHFPQSAGVQETRLAVGLSLAVLGILVTAAHQFLTRTTWRSITVIASTIILIVATALWWPWNLELGKRWNAALIRQTLAELPSTPEPAGLTFAFESAQMTPLSADHPDRPARMLLKFLVKGLPPTQGLMPYKADYQLRWADGTNEGREVWLSTDSSHLRRMRNVLGQLVRADDETNHVSATIFIAPEHAGRMQGDPPAFTMNATLRVMQFKSAVPASLLPGPRVRDGVATNRVARVDTEDQHVIVTSIKTYPDFWVNQVFANMQGFGLTYADSLLVNRERGEISNGSREWNMQVNVASVAVGCEKYVYAAPKSVGLGKLAQADWLRHAELTKENYTQQGRFTHEFKVDALQPGP